MLNYCSSCHKETNHINLQNVEKSYDDDNYRCTVKYFIVQCAGCDIISFRHEFHDIEGSYPSRNPYYPNEEEWITPITIDTYPKAIKNHIEIDGYHYIPENIYKAYKQTLSAFKEDANILTSIGFRAIIEAICVDQSAKGRTLEVSINNLYKKGILSKRDADLLHAIRFLGNDAAHEIKEPTINQLKSTLQIVEYMLNSIYILPLSVKGVMETVINTYEEFEFVLNKEIPNFSVGDEIPLRKILGSITRRFVGTLQNNEGELINKIKSGSYLYLDIGKLDIYQGSKDMMQHFVIKGVTDK